MTQASLVFWIQIAGNMRQSLQSHAAMFPVADLTWAVVLGKQ